MASASFPTPQKKLDSRKVSQLEKSILNIIAIKEIELVCYTTITQKEETTSYSFT